jgi:hypothetical protein
MRYNWEASCFSGIRIGAVVAHFRHRSLRPWMLCFAALTAAIILATVVSWHIVDDRTVFNTQLR